MKSNCNFYLSMFAAWTAICLFAPCDGLAFEKPFDQPVTRNDIANATHSKSVSARFSDPESFKDSENTPDFQRHVAPLLGRLGCNGRACHGSFQGQGGFQLSLFGYDFEKDHAALMEGRIDVEAPAESLLLTKPTDEDNHEGGLRYDVGSWQYNLLKGWVAAGAKTNSEPHKLDSLVVEPAELNLQDAGKKVQLRAIAHWADGTIEDVTELCRFKSNDPSIAESTETGIVNTNDIAGDTHVVVSYDSAVVPVPVIHPYTTPSYVRPPTPTQVDKLVADKWEKLQIQPANLSDDAMFLRRASLDITGTLPAPDEIRAFLVETNPNKRQKKIDELLESPAYAAWWTTFFCDMTENNTRELRNVSYNANEVSHQWYEWIRRRVEDNTPYDEMIEGIVLGVSRETDEDYREYSERMSSYYRPDSEAEFADASSMPYYWMRREFQDRDSRAISFAHAFLGLRIQCAQCHKHPFDQWSQDDFKQFSNFFSGVTFRNNQANPNDKKTELEMLKELGIDPKEKNRGNVRRKLAEMLKDGKTIPFSGLQVHKPRPTREEIQAQRKKDRKKKAVGPQSATLLGGDSIELQKLEDAREPLMEWMKQPNNPFFAKAIVNRVWARYFGVGIVDPADDLNLANPPSNAALLDYLASEFVSNGYDMKWLHRQIANSRTYQLSWETNDTNAIDRTNFSRALPRRLPAEVVFDAVASAASNPETNREFRNATDKRAIAIPGTDGYNFGKSKNKSVSSAFALKVFGRSERSSSCDCDRSEETSLIQTVYMQNDRDIQTLLTQKGSWVNQMIEKQRQKLLSDKERRQMAAANKKIAGITKSTQKLYTKKKSMNEEKFKKQLKALQKRRRDIETEIRPLRQKVAKANQDRKDVNVDEFVEEAYLRTLSRLPTKQETEQCVAFIDGDKDLIKGVTGVMWALMNTKEFIVNH